MWRRLLDWHREWKDQLLGVIEQPARAAIAQSGWRRRMASKIAAMPPLQRRQLHEFSLKYRGGRLYWTLAGMVLVFSLCGALWQFIAPGPGWALRILGANVVGFSLAAALASAWFDYRRHTQEGGKLLLTILSYAILGTAATTCTAMWASDTPSSGMLARLSHTLLSVAGGGMAIMLPILAISMLRNRQYEAITARLQREAEQERLARELSESRLRLLRAQIEPHFLFNTLGAVQQLAQHGAPRAAVLTANLIAFLRSSMSDMRSEQVSLAAEFALVESYLKVMQVRLGERLRYTLALPSALEQVQVPSMILLTLAENAIKHGIEPALRGGEVTLSARADGGALRIRVEDSGVGMSATPGSGTGLDNVRHRLRLAFGDSACLAFEEGDPGLVAEITIPHTVG